MSVLAKSKEIFLAALATSQPEDRDAYLRESCGSDVELRQQVEALLKAHEAPDSLLDQPRIDARGAVFPECETALLDRAVSELPGALIGPYKLLEQIGEGGFGVVFMAEQERPVRRRVAVKVIKPGMDTRQMVARFEAERQALALMDHPNIAKVLEAGETESGRPYFVMELVRGVPLTEFCDQNCLTVDERLELFMTVCHAVQHAHQKGIIHRDLKPTNVLVTLHDGQPVPKVIDFGVAKATGQRLTDRTLFTAFAQMVGTPLYMSPEQAEMSGLDVDTRSDIYSLGVMLYELLTGTTPFDKARLHEAEYDEIRRIIREEEPPKPSTRISTLGASATAISTQRKSEPDKLRRLLRGELDWIVMTCLDKDRNRRYETANSLARDIERYLRDEPVQACPPAAGYRLRKLLRRNRGPVAAGALLFVALVAGMIGTTLGLFEARQQRDLAKAAAQAELAAKEQLERNLYAADMNLAHQALEMGNLGRAIDLMEKHRPKPGEADLRGFEWRYLWQLCQGDEASTIRTTAIGVLAYSPDGQVLVSEGESKTVLREASTKKVITILPTTALSLAFSPRNKTLATAADQHVRLWDTENWRLLRELPGADHPAVFSSDGQWLATGGEHRLKLWDTTTWRAVSTNQTPLDFDWMSRYGMAFSPDARMLATANRASVKFWEVPSLKELPGLEGDIGRAGSLAFSKDGKYLVTGRANGAIDVWEVSTRQKVDTLRKHNGWVSVLAFSPDGQTLASASADQTIVLWSLEKRTSLATLKGHSHEVWALAFSPDNQTLASGSVDETIKFWNASARRTDEDLEDAYAPLSFSPDDRSLAFVGKNRVKFYDLATRQTAEFPAPATTVTSYSLCNVAISADHRTLAIGSSNGMIEIWDVHKKELLAAVEGHPGAKNLMVLSPDGKILAAARGSGNSPVKVWDVVSQQEMATFSGYDISSLAFSPQRDTLAVGSFRLATLWDVRSKRKLAALEGHKSFVEGLGFSSDGKLIATASADSTAKIWEAQTGRELVTLKGHREGVFAVCFTPDGRALATAGGDDKVRLWSLATYQEMASLPGQEDGRWITFSRDGNTMATGGWEHDTVRIWRMPSFAEIEAAEKQPK